MDSEKVKEKLLEIEKDIPVITIETGVGEEITHIGTDDYEMGYDLGVKILEDYQGIGPCYVTIIKEYMERISVQERFRGLMDALEITGRDVRIKTCARGEGDYNLALFLRKEMSEWYQDAVVALDKNTLEQSIEARQYWEAEKSERKPAFHLPGLYGIGNTEKTVNGLDSASVKALAYQNEFNMGYQGLEILINKKKNMFQDEVPVIKNQIVEKDTLYETENQRLLFPFS